MKKKLQYNVLVIILAFVCVHTSAQNRQASIPLIVTTIKPLAIIAKSALGDAGNVEYLQSGAQSAHDLALQVSALRKIDQANLVVWIGENFEARVAKTLKKLPDTKLVTVLELPVKQINSGQHQEKSPQQGGIHHRHLTVDPHVWLNPNNGNIIARHIQAQLGLPENDIISAGEIAQLRVQLEPYASHNYLSHHDAFAHFVAAFDLQPSLSIRDASGAQQGAKTQYKIRRAAVQGGAHCIFVEPQYADKDARVMAQSLQLPVRPLDSQGFDQPLTEQAYSEFMRSLVTQFKACFD